MVAMSVDIKYPGLGLKIVSSLLNKFSENEPRVFVEIEARGKRQRTKVETSLQPIWEEDFQLEFSAADTLFVKLKYEFLKHQTDCKTSIQD